jgi:hypothetical protein
VTTKPDTIILVHGFGAVGVAIDSALDWAVSHAGEARPQPTSGA